MDFEFAMKIFFELGLVGCILYGYKHEEDLIEIETILKWYIKKQWRLFIEKRSYLWK